MKRKIIAEVIGSMSYFDLSEVCAAIQKLDKLIPNASTKIFELYFIKKLVEIKKAEIIDKLNEKLAASVEAHFISPNDLRNKK